MREFVKKSGSRGKYISQLRFVSLELDTMKYIEVLSGKIEAYHNCVKSDNVEWASKHREWISSFEKYSLPHGSGIDGNNTIELSECSSKKIVIYTEYHHMDEFGGYDGWTEHKITITPAFNGFDMKISGRDKNMIKEYLLDIFSESLNDECPKGDK